MSNIAFNFLTESFLFNEADSVYHKRTLQEIDNEIEKYRNYIIANLKNINDEINKKYNFIQPLLKLHTIPSMNELLQGSIFLDTYLIDDPIFSYNCNSIKFANYERKKVGLKEVTDDDIKKELSDLAIYMKSLTKGVTIEIGYIKFYPFSLGLQYEYNPQIKIPDLSINNIPENVYNWFKERLVVLNMENNRTNSKLTISNKILLFFKDDEEGEPYFEHLHQIIPEKYNGKTLRIRLDGDYIPDLDSYNNWVSEMSIKTIKNKILSYAYRDEICSFFNSPICLQSAFEQSFYNTNFQNNNSNFHKLGFNLNIPGLQNISFDKAMEIRKSAHLSFLAFQEKLLNDSKALRTTTDEKQYDLIIQEIEQDYLNSINKTHSFLDSAKDLFSLNNLINIGLFAESYFTGNNSKITTGLTIVNGIYNATKIVKKDISNPMYFLKKISK